MKNLRLTPDFHRQHAIVKAEFAFDKELIAADTDSVMLEIKAALQAEQDRLERLQDARED